MHLQSGPLPGIGIAKTTDFVNYKTLNATWLEPNGANNTLAPEIVLEVRYPLHPCFCSVVVARDDHCFCMAVVLLACFSTQFLLGNLNRSLGHPPREALAERGYDMIDTQRRNTFIFRRPLSSSALGSRYCVSTPSAAGLYARGAAQHG